MGSSQFRELQRRWYDKLAAKGFEDIEKLIWTGDEYLNRDKASGHDRKGKSKLSVITLNPNSKSSARSKFADSEMLLKRHHSIDMKTKGADKIEREQLFFERVTAFLWENDWTFPVGKLTPANQALVALLLEEIPAGEIAKRLGKATRAVGKASRELRARAERQRAVWELYAEGLTAPDIAERLDLTKRQVNQTIQDVRAAMRRFYGQPETTGDGGR